ncbi:hypothetical protein HOLleu_08767 [Holothuria leucospilota]|uniref:Uncharacterized protein n=1 Tax=Holothuria leucospilota TaxID=206669 RepID=A0A9Q1CJP4_HOLLE|nr:hypothetical protein HOLleu_08767 [Holothuria leucospilota]
MTSAVGAGWLLFSSYLSFMEHFGESFPLAYSIRELFTYLGVTFMPPMMEFFRGQYGLHGSFLVTGAVIWNAVVSGVLMKSVNSPKYAATDERTVAPMETESALSRGKNEKQSTHQEFLSFLSISPAVEHPTFALFMIIHSLFSYIFVVWALFLVPFATSIGFSPEIAVFLSTAGGVGGFLGKIAVVVMFYLERMNILVSSLVPAAMYSLALLGYIFSEQYTVLLGVSVVSGFSIAFADAALNASMPRYLPERLIKQGTVMSYIYSGVFMQLGGIISGKQTVPAYMVFYWLSEYHVIKYENVSTFDKNISSIQNRLKYVTGLSKNFYTGTAVTLNGAATVYWRLLRSKKENAKSFLKSISSHVMKS